MNTLLLLALVSIIPGQLLRIPLTASAFVTLTDVFVGLLFAVSPIYFLLFRKSLKLDLQIVIPALVFSLCATASTVLAINVFTPKEILVSSLFLLRFIMYFFVFVATSNIVPKNKVQNWQNTLLTVGVIFTMLGLLQLILIPDLTPYVRYGWDPHQNRLFSTLLDPNFTGGLLSMFLALSLGQFLKTQKKVYLTLSGVFFLGIILTFSRSSYLAAFATVGIFGILKSPKLLFAFTLVSLLAYFTIPQIQIRVKGALEVDETSQARIESWQNAVEIIKKQPVFGVGFNTYRYAQEQAGFFPQDRPEGGNSGAGSDSSLLLVAATTGLVGFTAYIIFLLSILKKVAKRVKASTLNLSMLSIVISLLIHSQFVNSLFFPQIMLAFWFILGLTHANDS